MGNSNDEEEEENTGPEWVFLPVSEYLDLPGVQDVTRVGQYTAHTSLSGGRQQGVYCRCSE